MKITIDLDEQRGIKITGELNGKQKFQTTKNLILTTAEKEGLRHIFEYLEDY